MHFPFKRFKALMAGFSLGCTVALSAHAAPVAVNGRFQLLYAAQDDGTIHVYDINNSHHQLKVVRAFPATSGADVRGACMPPRPIAFT